MPNFTLAKTKNHHLFSTLSKAHAPQIHPNYTNTPHHHHTSSSATTADNEAVAATTPDIAAAYASPRFFMANPGKSNSITDSEAAEVVATAEVGGCVVVQTYSPDPYVDFRQSMQEMVEARDVHAPKEAWDYLQELLITYLSLNPKSTHKYILGAFADLFVSLLSPTSSSSSISSSPPP